MKKLLSILAAMALTTTSISFGVSCNLSKLSLNIEKNHENNVSLLKWNIPNEEHEFVVKYENKIKNKASGQSNQAFADLYDNNKSPRIWNDYQSLEKDLTNTKIGNKKIDVNWTKMYKDAKLSKNAILKAQKEQLRFYNIIGKVYHKSNIIRLVQKVEAVSVSDNIVAWTAYNSNNNNQRMGFGPDFVNPNLTDAQYQAGWWSSNNPISVTVHEYGHAWSNFLGLDNVNRASFNTNWTWPTFPQEKNNYLNLQSNTNDQSFNFFKNSPNKIIPSRADYLIEYLDSKANIQEKTEKLLFPLIVVRSNYSRSAWSKGDNDLKDEFFAEAFAEWLLTPENLRTWNWELLNDFFLNYLPQTL